MRSEEAERAVKEAYPYARCLRSTNAYRVISGTHEEPVGNLRVLASGATSEEAWRLAAVVVSKEKRSETARLKWRNTADGGAELKTDMLCLIITPHTEGGWDCRIYNSGRYRRLYENGIPLLGDLAHAKRHLQEVAFYVLRDAQKALEAA